MASFALILLLLATLSTASHAATTAASSSLVTWSGRVQVEGDSVAFDWEGVSASVTISAFTNLVVSISDNCLGSSVGGGSRWAVFMTPSDTKVSAANHRISTFFSSSLVSTYVMYSNPSGGCDPFCSATNTTTFTLTRITESRLSRCIPGNNLTVASFSTDGQFLPPPPQKARKLEFVGDSITAGDLLDTGGASVCANAAWNDDVSLSSGSRLCGPLSLGGFDADCMHTAWGGITLGDKGWGMSQLYPHTFSSGGGGSEYLQWNFSAFDAAAVVMNLGTNDRPAPNDTHWSDAYAAFAADVALKYYARPDIVLFLAYGPMTNYYQALVERTITALRSMVPPINAYPLDLTLAHPMTGCYNHPSALDNVEIAAKARPQISKVLGWE